MGYLSELIPIAKKRRGQTLFLGPYKKYSNYNPLYQTHLY